MIANGSLPGPVPLVKTALSFQQEPALWLSVRRRLDNSFLIYLFISLPSVIAENGHK